MTGKSNLIISKLKEFNELIEETHQLNNDELQVVNDVVCDLLRNSENLRAEVYASLITIVPKLVEWPVDKLLPVLDILRLLVLDEKLAVFMYGGDQSRAFANNLVAIAQRGEPTSNILLAFRICTNSFASVEGALVVYEHRKDILDVCGGLYEKQHKNLSIAVSSLMVNFAVYCVKMNCDLDDRVLFSTFINAFVAIPMDDEALFRLLVAFGTILHGCDHAVKYCISLETNALVKNVHDRLEAGKAKDCAQQICNLFLQ